MKKKNHKPPSLYRAGSLYCVLFLFLALTGCAQGKQHVFREYLNTISRDSEYAVIRAGLHDSINSWINRGLDPLQFYKHTDWKIDSAVFFDSKKEKALLLILVMVKSSSFPMDYVKTIGAEKINGKWEYYYSSYAVIDCERSTNGGSAYSFDALSRIGRNELISDGFVKCGLRCRIDRNYVDSDTWFKQWMRDMHKKFLKNELPKDPIAKTGERMF